jgi:hypothetical protein
MSHEMLDSAQRVSVEIILQHLSQYLSGKYNDLYADS